MTAPERNESFDLRASAAFELLLLSLAGVGALGLRNELAIALWVTILVAAVLHVRSRRDEPLPRARLVQSRSAADQRTHRAEVCGRDASADRELARQRDALLLHTGTR